jgi:CRISPR-associated protein Cas6
MSDPIDLVDLVDLVDLAFPVEGRAVPAAYRAPLAAALAARLPWLGQVAGTGMHRLNLAAGAGGLLSGRTRLTLRVPSDRVDEVAAALAGRAVDLGGERLVLGVPVWRALLPHRTLYAHFVDAEDDEELGFLARMDTELQRLGVACRTVCGRLQSLPTPEGALAGYSLLLDGLSPEHALRVMNHGLGAHRALGCGLFIPHKSAAAVGA